MEVKLSQRNEKKVEEIVKILKSKDTFLITSHINIDGDAIGSELALYICLKKLNKKVQIINNDKIPSIFKFLPFSQKIKTYFMTGKKVNFDAGIILDSGSLERVGNVKEIIKKIPFIINIDHHLTNSNFGNINWINPYFSSSGEMMYFLCDKLNKIDRNQAICLYTSILYDTCGFVHRVNKYTMEIAKRLIDKKINPEKIAQKIFYEKSIKSVNLFKLALNTLKFDRKRKICIMKIPLEFYKKTKTNEEHTEGFVDFLISIKGVEVGILFKEKKNGTKVSMRSKGKIDVESVARKFDGGGHREAAGCFLENKKIDEVESLIMEELKWTEY
ncbi:MAG: bifunctional oligoribonuclease/PAP phosphatase NrnA [Candidatus Omnitrophica bacterium]|nr:bifunctional oligoribonuclease/PAP phosphatase NrnA [Candidatus Omnitrophota bacterium]MCM8803139.1 bifunctional oligoribonuclease/PAP phosphatase NrnA [Candidatus Omnitrophota bacterium]